MRNLSQRSFFGGAFVTGLGCIAGGLLQVTSALSDTGPDPNDSGLHVLDESQAKLKLVQVVFRHGARTPLTKKEELWKDQPEWKVCGPTPFKAVKIKVVSTQGQVDPVNKSNLKQMARRMPGGCFAGELSQVGHYQALELGQRLRKRYMEQLGFLNPAFQMEAVRCRSTNYDRTLKTLTGVLTGLFPECSETIPVTTSSDIDEILFADSRTCPHLGGFLQLGEVLSRESVSRDPEYGWARAEIKKVFGITEDFFKSSKWPIDEVHDAITSMQAHGKTLPEGLTTRLITAINRLATREFAAYTAPSIKDERGRTVVRLSMGVLLHTLVSNMEEATTASTGKDKKFPKIYLYSGHDSTIMPLLAALGMDLVQWPPYASNLAFELWELPDGQHVVRVLMNLSELHIPGCPPGLEPSLAKFTQEVVGPFILSASQWGQACQAQVTHDGSLPQITSPSSSVSVTP